VALGAAIHGSRVTVSRASGAGLLATDRGSRVTLDQVWIAGTQAEACGAACADRAAGHGVVSIYEAAVTLTHVRVSDSAWAGVLVANDGVLSLADGSVDGNQVGRAILQMTPAGFSTTNVVYDRNVVLEAREGVVVPPPTLL
jgi:hypothetical protein